jgi:hypothetical protein
MRIERLPGNPIIRPHMDARMGTNINGPSLIRVPRWIDDPLGTYYLYFADHKGPPERILLSTIDLRPDWMTWQASAPIEVLRPEYPWEGSNEPLAPSIRGAIKIPGNQLRDPAVFVDDDRTFLLYSVAGESDIAIAEVFLDA